MNDLEIIFNELNLDLSLLSDFKSGIYLKFQKACHILNVKTLSLNEAFLMWSLILKYKPQCFLEIGGQHGHSGMIFSDAVKSYNGTFVTIELGKNSQNKYEYVGTLAFLPDDDPYIVKVWGDAVENLPNLLETYPVEMVFHDAAHTYKHVMDCVSIIKNCNENIIQTCHDCKTGLWNPDELTRLGYICAERPVFDKTFSNPNYYYNVYEDLYGVGISINKNILK